MSLYRQYKLLAKEQSLAIKSLQVFYKNIKQIQVKRHQLEKSLAQSSDERQALMIRHKHELDELVESEALAIEGLQEKHQQEKKALRRTYLLGKS